MGTKKKTKTTLDFNKPSMGVFDALQPQIQNTLMQYLQGALTDSPFFREALAFGQKQSSLLGQRGIRNVFQNMAAFGGAQPAGFQQSLLNRAGRASSSLQSNAFWNAFSAANQGRMAALAQAQAFRPLQTGQTTVEKTSGLGTWLPQVLGAAASIGMAPFTGGASLAGLGGVMSPGGASFPANAMGTPQALQGWSSLPATAPNIGGQGSWFGSIPSSSQLGGLLGSGNLMNLPPR